MASIDELYGMPKKKPLTVLDLLYGVGEMAAQMGTGAMAQLGGGLAYLPSAAMGGDRAGQATMNAVSDAFTYQPRTDAANRMMGAVGETIAPFAKSGSVGAQTFADNVYGATGSPLLGAAARAAPTAVDMLADRLRLGKMGEPAKNEITAYHGGPHDFDEFSLDRIGTGEGAQAYGHGLYFADNKNVAKEYAEQISKLRGKDQGIIYTVEIPDEVISKMLDWDSPVKNTPEIYNKLLDTPEKKQHRRKLGDMYHDAIEAGDKEMSAKIRKELEMLPPSFEPYELDKMTGRTVMAALAKFDDSRGFSWGDSSQTLLSMGIPGIRYLDEGSRGAGQGTKNTVLFDDKLVKVLRKE